MNGHLTSKMSFHHVEPMNRTSEEALTHQVGCPKD